MFIRKMLEFDWLDYGTWTIYTFPYRRSGPFIRLSIKVKTQDFWKDGREAIDRGREKLVTFEKIVGKFSETFRKDLKRWIITFLAEFSISLHSAQTFRSMF